MIIAILILGLVLRLIGLNQSLWLDEAVQAITSQGSLAGVFSELRGDFHPPLYHLLMWIWVHLFGSNEVILRLPSVLFGVATIFVVYLLAKEIFPQKQFPVPEIAALFLATAPFHIYYSQEARPYALVAFLVVCSMYFFLKERWLSYIVSMVLALYSSYLVVFVLLAQATVRVLVFKKRLPKLLYCYTAILLLFLPWVPLFLAQIRVGQQAVLFLPEWGRLVNVSFIKVLPLTFIKFTIGRITIFNKILYGLITGALFLVYGGIILRGFFKSKKLSIINYQLSITLWFFIPILCAWLISLFIPNYQPFRLLLVLPAFYLLLAWGIVNFQSKMIQVILAMVILLVNLISVGVYYSNLYFHREDWRGIVRFIELQNKFGVAILPSATSDWPWRYYSSGKVKMFGVVSAVRKVQDEDFSNLTIQQDNNLTIFFIRYLQPLFDPDEKITFWLQSLGYVKIKEINFNQIPVWEYRFGR